MSIEQCPECNAVHEFQSDVKLKTITYGNHKDTIKCDCGETLYVK